MAVKWMEQRKQYRQYQARIAALPSSYRAAVAALERYINHLGGMDDADSIVEMLNDLADLFEQAAADATAIREIVGDDPVVFADDFLSNYPAGRWIARERERLVAGIDAGEREQVAGEGGAHVV